MSRLPRPVLSRCAVSCNDTDTGSPLPVKTAARAIGSGSSAPFALLCHRFGDDFLATRNAGAAHDYQNHRWLECWGGPVFVAGGPADVLVHPRKNANTCFATR